MVGLPASGKTTCAHRFAEECGALLLTPDVWHLRLFGQDATHEDHDRRHTAIEIIMWDVAKRVLIHGCDVILDFGFWGREERYDFRRRAEALGIAFQMHYMDVSREELFRRLEIRNQSETGDTFIIPTEYMERYIAVFQPPAPDELLYVPAVGQMVNTLANENTFQSI